MRKNKRSLFLHIGRHRYGPKKTGNKNTFTYIHVFIITSQNLLSQQNAKNSFIYTISYIVFIDSYYKNKDYRIEICAQ